MFSFWLKIFCLTFGEIDFRLKPKTKGKTNEVNSSKITTENNDDIIDGLKTLHLKHPQNPIVDQINSNSIRNKFETLVSPVTSDIDILMISEKK